jgi:hypothetical protein
VVDRRCLQEWCVCDCVCVRVCVCKRPLLYCARALHAKNVTETRTSNRAIFPTRNSTMYLQYSDAHVKYDARCAVTGQSRQSYRDAPGTRTVFLVEFFECFIACFKGFIGVKRGSQTPNGVSWDKVD